jgi:hypothetical protein
MNSIIQPLIDTIKTISTEELIKYGTNSVGANLFMNSISMFITNYPKNLENRKKEFIEILEANKEKLTEEIFKSECFVSRLALTFDKVLREYSDIKRQHIYNIFLGFCTSEDIEKFELEKMYHTLDLMSIEDLEHLTYFKHDKFLKGDISDSISSLTSLGIVKQLNLELGHYTLTEFGEKFKKYCLLNYINITEKDRINYLMRENLKLYSKKYKHLS